MQIKQLTGEQRRQLIDCQQAYEAWRHAHLDGKRRFRGSMRWAERNGTKYLLRKIGAAEKSLGPRDQSTEAAYVAFINGRSENQARLQSLSSRIDALAPVNIAMGLGRVPVIAARILRECDERGLLGAQLTVVGTNALYAYEIAAGVHVGSDLIASADIDLMYDARRNLRLAVSGMEVRGLIGVLQEADQSFAPLRPRSFRAANRDGYLVDLIRPEAKDVFRDRLPSALTDLPEDLEAVAIYGLGWLVNSPKLEAIAIDDKGYPVRIIVIDPRAYALHKAWISKREDREPLKATRDLEQAKTAAAIAVHYLRLSFDAPELTALPAVLLEGRSNLLGKLDSTAASSTTPKW